MEALTCANCPTVGTPSTMYWHPVEGDTDDEGQPCAVYGALCRSCAIRSDQDEAWWTRRKPDAGETLRERDEGPEPEEDDLLRWATGEGFAVDEFAEEVVERAGMADLPRDAGAAMADVPLTVVADVAQEWWSDGRIDWLLDEMADQDGERTMSLALVGTTTRRTNA